SHCYTSGRSTVRPCCRFGLPPPYHLPESQQAGHVHSSSAPPPFRSDRSKCLYDSECHNDSPLIVHSMFQIGFVPFCRMPASLLHSGSWQKPSVLTDHIHTYRLSRPDITFRPTDPTHHK